MNWIIAKAYEDYESLCIKDSLDEYEAYRLQELEQEVDYYNRTYKGGD